MTRGAIGFVLAVLLAALLTGGCAKKVATVAPPAPVVDPPSVSAAAPSVREARVSTTPQLPAERPAGSCKSVNGLPDRTCTPGVIDPRVTQANIQTTICKSGYTATVRPPTSYTNALKIQQIREYGYSDTNVKDYEEDHLISLEIGGNPTDPKNLWPEFPHSPNPKDKIENELHKKVCAGQMTLAEAQKEISTNWELIK